MYLRSVVLLLLTTYMTVTRATLRYVSCFKLPSSAEQRLIARLLELLALLHLER